MKKLLLPILISLCACYGSVGPGAPDAGPTSVTEQSVDLNTQWTRHSVVDGSTTNRSGADGAHLIVLVNQTDVSIGVGYEQSSKVAISTLSGGTWTTVEMGGNSSVEDVKLADVDGQGQNDAVSFGQGKSIKIHWAETGPADITITPTSGAGSQEWLAGAVADLDGDGDVDIIGGGRRAAYPPAYVSWFENPGGTLARTAANWSRHDIGVTGLTMMLEVSDVDFDGDPDIVQTDRDPYWTGVGTTSNTLRGTRWYENDGSRNFTNRMVVNSVNLGEPKMFSLQDIDADGDPDIVDGSSVVSQNPQNHLYVRTNQGDFKSWSPSEVTLPSGIGNYHHGVMTDVDGDGHLDIVVSCSEAYDAGKSGVFWLQSDGMGGYNRGEISGDDGDKYDNVVIHDMDGDGDPDVVTTEQHETNPPSNNTQAGHGTGQGLEWYENPQI
jgi:hypothetical protein